MKAIYKTLALSLICALTALSCSPKEEIYSETVLDPITVGHDMTSAIFEVEVPTLDNLSNHWYLASPANDTWLTYQIIPSTKSLWICLDGNVSGKVRTSFIQIRCKGQSLKLIVEQDCEPILETSRTSANFRYQGGTQAVRIMNFADLKDVKASLDDDCKWCTSEIRNDSIILTATENPVVERLAGILTINATRRISGDSVTAVVELSQDEHGLRPSYEYAADEEDWVEDIPATFSVLRVRTNNGVKISRDDLLSYINYIAQQAAPAGLDLSEADYDTETFPADVFAGTALEKNTTLKSIKLPRNIKTVPAQAFVWCEALETVDLTGVSTVGEEAFTNCNNLKHANLTNVKNIGARAFYSCASLETVELTGVSTIDNEAFRASGLKTLTIPNTVTMMGTYVFADCLNLVELYYNSPYDPNADGSKTNTYTFYLTETNIENPSLNVTIGPDTKNLPRCTFRHNNAVVKITCEDAVYFRQYAASICCNLAVFEFKCADEESIPSNKFASIIPNTGDPYSGVNVPKADRKIIVPKGTMDLYKASTGISEWIEKGGFTMVEAD